MYGSKLVFEIFLTFLSENMAKMQIEQKNHYSKANKAIDVVFAENLD